MNPTEKLLSGFNCPLERRFFEILSCLLLFAFASCQSAGKQDAEVAVITDHRVMMDTVVSITVYAADKDSSAVRADMAKAFDAMQSVDSSMSSYSAMSEVAVLNRRAASEAVAVSAATDTVLQTAFWASEISHGAFDVTIAPVLQLWGFGADHRGVPSEASIKERLPLLNYRLLEKKNGAVSYLRPGMAIDLGGVAKGYAVDLAIGALRRAGYRDAMVKAGGDLRTLSSPLTAGRRYIWIQHPRAKDKFFGKFRFDSGAVSTSGEYERFFERDGVRYHHIIDPKTGYPARGAVSATVLANDSRTADALSTALFVLGPERGITLADSLEDIEAVILSINGGKILWRATRGFAERLEVIDDVVE